MKIKDNKKYILSPTEPTYVEAIPQEKLGTAKVEIIKQMFNYHTLTGQKYQKFIYNFIQYSLGILNTENANVVFDPSLKWSEGYQDDELANIMICYSLRLALTKSNTKSKEQFENAYKLAYILESKKFSNLMNKMQYDVIDFLIKQPFFTIDAVFLEKEYQKYHTKEEFEKFFKEQKIKEKQEEENRKKNLEKLLNNKEKLLNNKEK